MRFHLYTDDTQSYLSFDFHDPVSNGEAITKLESCIAEIRTWMLKNKLKLNNDKTEYIYHVFHTM